MILRTCCDLFQHLGNPGIWLTTCGALAAARATNMAETSHKSVADVAQSRRARNLVTRPALRKSFGWN
jgi:hypothetical protein